MALDGTAAGLRASIAEWLQNATLVASAPDFITIAESRMNRLLRITDQETRATATMVGEFLTLPPDFGGMRSVHQRGSPNRFFNQMEASAMLERYAFTNGNPYPGAYSISNNVLRLSSNGGTGQIEMVYWRRIPPLATNETNWLLQAHPDVYLYGSLMAAEMHGWNDARLPMLKMAFDEGIAEIEADSEKRRWGASAIVPALNCIA